MTETRQFSCRQLTVFYAMVLKLSGEADPALLASLGLDAAELRARLEQGGPEADAARLLLLGGHTGSRRILALMLRGALLDRLTSVEKAAELRDLATAMSRMPAWVFEDAQSPRPSQGGTGGPRGGTGGSPVNINPVGATHASPAGSADILSARSADFQSASAPPYPIETEHTPAAESSAADYSGTTCEKGRGTTAGEDRGDGAGGQDYSFTFDDSLPDDADPGPG